MVYLEYEGVVGTCFVGVCEVGEGEEVEVEEGGGGRGNG